jgi:hypothetical protein
MPLEYEYVFRNYNKKKLIETIKQNGGYFIMLDKNIENQKN